MTVSMIEEIRNMRACLPLPEALVQEVSAVSGVATLATQETVPLLLRYLGHPAEVSTSEQEASAVRAKAKFAQIIGTEDMAVMVCMARAAIDFGPQYVVHTLHPTATRTVLETDLAFWPTTAPRILTRPLLVQALPGKGTGCLYRDITTLLYLPGTDGTVALTFAMRQNGRFLHDAIPMAWSAEDDPRSVEEVLRTALHPVAGDGDRVRSAEVLRWLVTFGLFLEAEGQSGRRVSDVRTEAGTLPDGRKPKVGQGFTIKHVRISDEALVTPPRKPSEAEREAPPHPEGLVAEPVMVRGFLRRQPCGPGNKDRKVIFVAPFQRQQWVSPEREVRVR